MCELQTTSQAAVWNQETNAIRGQYKRAAAQRERVISITSKRLKRLIGTATIYEATNGRDILVFSSLILHYYPFRILFRLPDIPFLHYARITDCACAGLLSLMPLPARLISCTVQFLITIASAIAVYLSFLRIILSSRSSSFLSTSLALSLSLILVLLLILRLFLLTA